MRTTMTAAVAFAALLAATAADAAETRNSANQEGATATNPAGSDVIKPDQMRASKIIGGTVYDRENRDIGKVQDLVLDKDGRIAAVVVSVGGFVGIGAKNVAVKMSDIRTDNNRLTIDRTKEQLEQATNYQLTDRETGAGRTTSPPVGGQAGSSEPKTSR